MAAEPARTLQVDESAHAAVAEMVGSSRNIKGAISNALRWIANLDADIRTILFDGVSPDMEVVMLRKLLERAERRAGRGLDDDLPRAVTTPPGVDPFKDGRTDRAAPALKAGKGRVKR